MEKKANFSSKESRHSILPPRDLQCVWVSAGLLAYKLCKYNFDCERCPLDWELRNVPLDSLRDRPLPERTTEPKPLFREDPSVFQIKESLFYHPGHTWLKVERADQVRVGLDPFVGRLVEGVKVVVLPLSGTRGIRGDNLCSIILEHGILQISLPISGLILSVNPRLKDHPELVCSDPLGEGYLVTVKPKNLQRDQKYLLTGEAACQWYQREWERFKEGIVSELRSEPEKIGTTLQDGGICLNDIKQLIPPNRFLQVVRAFLRNRGQNHFQNKFKRETILSLHPE